MELPDVGANSGKLKGDWNYFVVDIVKMCVGSVCADGTLKLTVSEEWTDAINWLLHAIIDLQKIKSDRKIFCWVWVKKKGRLDFNFHLKKKFRNTKSWFNDFWVGVLVRDTLKTAGSYE